MHRLLQDFAEFVGRDWARRWVEHLQQASEEQGTSVPEQRELNEDADRAPRPQRGANNNTD